MTNRILQHNKVNNAQSKSSRREGIHFTFFILLLLSLTLGVKALPVDMRLAREIGAKFVNANTTMRVLPDRDLQWVITYRTANNEDAFHVFNTPKGFVIVAADDCATPVLGYSEKEHFNIDSIPVQMQEYLQGFVEQIQYGIDNHLQADETIVRQWNLVQATGRLTEQRAIKAVSPMLTDKWYQDCYYNDLCPEDPNGSCGHVFVGCTAVAYGQIMRYWGYPINGSGSVSYTPAGFPQQDVNFAETTYQWSYMPNRLKASSDSIQVNAVATLLWHCGVAIQIDYAPGLGGTTGLPGRVPDALTNYFNYSSDLYSAFMSNYSYDTWLSMVKNCLDNGRPIYYCGWDSNGNNGHSFVCDGYDSNDLLHFNWGWSGHGNNDYFALGALHINNHDYSYDNYAIFDIHPNCPPGTSYQVIATPSPIYGGTVEGGGTYSCGENCTLTAVPDSSYMFCSWTENGVIVSTEPSYTFNVSDTVDLVANFISDDVCSLVFNLYGSNGDSWNGKALTVSYSAGCDSLEELTFDSDTTVTITRNVPNGSHIVLGWISDDGSDDCSFSVKYADGNTIYESDSLSNSFSYEFDVTCGETYYYITTTSNPSSGGTTTGDGSYLQGSTCVLNASADSGYSFANWTKNGALVSTSPTYSFIVTEDAIYEANFTEIVTVDLQVIADYYPKTNDSDSLFVVISWGNSSPTEFAYDFNDGILPAGWTTIDADDDGYNWMFATELLGTNYGHNDSTDCILSQSYDNELGEELFPDNYLVSEKVNITNGSHFSFYACAHDNEWAAEHFGVFVSLNSNIDLNDFQEVQSWTITAKGRGGRAIEDNTSHGDSTQIQGNWYYYEVDLSAFVGEGYIAIRHYDCSNWFCLDIDDVALGTTWIDYSTYSIYRSNCDSDEMQLIADSITGIQYIDTNWVDLTLGNYKYGVSVVSDGRRGESINWIEPNTPKGNREMWNLITTFNAADSTQFGVATDGENIYTSNEAWSDTTYSFFKYDLLGNMIEGFNIDSCGSILDLTYDGQYFYGGANDSVLYCIDLANHNLVSTTNTSCSNILHCSYDPINDGFWVGSWNDLMLIDRSGGIITDGPDIDSVSVSGTGYYKDKNDNPHLYLFAQSSDGAKVYDYNILTDTIGDMLMDFTTTPGYDTGISSGAFIGEYNGKIAFFGNVQQSPNLIGIYELDDNIQTIIYWSNCIEKEPSLSQQSTELQAGWNWWSTNLDITLDQLKEALVTALPDTASITIKSQTQSTSYNGSIWRGQLNAINTSQMYEIQTPESCIITLTGMPMSQVELTIHNGNNWIALPINDSISLIDAFGIFPIIDDIIKSKEGRATYIGTMWRGTFQNLEPGQGYIYKSAAEEDRTFSFPADTE